MTLREETELHIAALGYTGPHDHAHVKCRELLQRLLDEWTEPGPTNGVKIPPPKSEAELLGEELGKAIGRPIYAFLWYAGWIILVLSALGCGGVVAALWKYVLQ